MKAALVSAVLLVALTIGCDQEQSPSPAPPPPKKTVVAKDKHLESHYNLITGKQVQETKYTLIFDGGSTCDVDVGTYYRVKEGDMESCN